MSTEEQAYYALNRRVFASFARYYDLVVLPLERLRREVASLANLARTDVVLDVATGTGKQAFAFAPHVSKVVGVDLSDAMLGVARRKNQFGNLVFQQADGASLPFGDASFDAASISFGLHEMPRSIRDRVLREMVRVTKPGGVLIVVDYALPANPLAAWLGFHAIRLYERDHYAEFVREDLDAMLRSVGVEPMMAQSALGGLATIRIGRLTRS